MYPTTVFKGQPVYGEYVSCRVENAEEEQELIKNGWRNADVFFAKEKPKKSRRKKVADDGNNSTDHN